MSCCNKDKTERNTERNDCLNNSIKSHREMIRVCPSKLSKRELEDLYFTLLENNLELKKTIHKQLDKIKVLSTQVQRQTNNQEKLVNKEMKECCSGTRAYVNEQKALIKELKETNQRLAERIQQLTMRLSSAKQFSKTSPPQLPARPPPFRGASSTPKKHDCITKIQEARLCNEAPPQTSTDEPLKLSTFSQWEDEHDCVTKVQEAPPQTSPDEPRKLCTSSQWEDELSCKATQTQMPIEKSPKSDEPCEANKCRTLMEELKLEIFNLQEELTIVHYDYSTRIGRLEAEVAEVRKENVRVSSERTASQHELQNTLKQNGDIQAWFRKSEAKCAELAAELSIEKRKVAELDTLMKAANLTDRLSKTMEEHLITITNWLPDITNQKEEPAEPAEDRVGKSSPTKYIMTSKSTSSAGKTIKVEHESPTKTSSKDLVCNPCECESQIMSCSPSTAEAAALGEVGDRKNQERTYPSPKDLSPRPKERQKNGYPPPKDLLPRPEDRKNLDKPPYRPSKDLSTRLEDRKNQEHAYPPNKDLSQRPEERQKHRYPPPKDLLPRPEDRKNLDKPPYRPSKDLSTRLEDRKNQEHTYPPPKDLSPWPEERQKREYPPPKDLSPLAEDRSKGSSSCSCSPSTDLSTLPADRTSKSYSEDACTDAKKKTSRLKAKEEEVICRCPTWVQLPEPPPQEKDKDKECCNCPPLAPTVADVNESPEDKILRRTSIERFPSPPLMDHYIEDERICNKCKKDMPGATESPPRSNDKGLSTRGAQTRFSPTKDKDDTKSTNTADDSGYQESDEMALVKINKELLLKISELQHQVDCLKIGVSQMSEAQSSKLRERQETSAKSTDPTITSVPRAPIQHTKASESSETKLVRHASVDSSIARMESPPSLNSEMQCCLRKEHLNLTSEIDKTLPFPPKASDEQMNQPQRQKLKIEVLGHPKDSESKQIDKQLSDETRAKTIQRNDGTLQIPEDRSTTTSYDSTTEYKTPKLTITEKKKLKLIDSNQPDIKSEIGPRLAFNPEKLKYLENEGIIAKLDLENHQTKLEEDLVSIAESIPSNPELGFGIPRLTSMDKKGEIHSGQAKTSPTAGPSPQRVPMTETSEQTDETKKEDCEYCAACSFDKECELKHKNALNPLMTQLAHGMQKDQIENHDLLYDLQKDKEKNMFCQLMKDRNRNQKKKCPTKDEMFASQKVHAQKRGITTGQPVNLADVPFLDQRENCKTNSFLESQDSITVAKKTMLKKDKCVQKQYNEDDFIEGPILLSRHTSDTAVGPVILPDVPLLRNRRNRKLNNDTTDIQKNYNHEIPMFEIKTPTEETRLAERTEDVFQSPEHKLPEKASQAVTTTTYKAEAPRVGSRESARQRDVSMYRHADGSICYRPVRASQDQSICDCPGQVDGYCTEHSKNKGVQGNEAKKLGSPSTRHAQRTVERGTYTLGSNRAETPDTEYEMSYLPDLPLENEKKSPSKLRPLSPGEDRTTTHTSTQSDYSHPTTARYSLSEGEMPPSTRRRSSVGIDKPYLNPTLAHKLETPPSYQMEAALNAITDELQRCKNLLQAKRYDERQRHITQPPAPSEPRPIALKPALATQGIGNTHAPISIFTLHIGTVVLNDEAILYSRNKNLVLKWKFYKQPVTMARMRAGRVVVFDFSTQYDIEVTEDFLNYLKHEEMPMIICELDQEQPFATATLPLRDALLLANTRADKSVALLAGPQMCDARAASGVADAASLSGGARDEVGVIDLWYKLRADAGKVPGINLTIAQPGATSKTQQQPDVIQQVLHDYNELDFTMGSSKPAGSNEPTGKNETYADVEYSRPSNPWQQERKLRTKHGTETTQTVSTTTEQPDLSAYPAPRPRTRVAAPAGPSAAPPPFAPRASSLQSTLPTVPYRATPMHQDSDMIIREVNTRIKTPEDIALVAGRQLSETWSRIPKFEDDSVSQTQFSSHSSLRSVLNRLHKRGSRPNNFTHAGEKRKFIERLKKAGIRTGDGPLKNTYNDRVEHMETYKKKYENISKIGPNRAEQSKKVTIQNEHNFDDNMVIQQPQREVVQEPKQRKIHQPSTHQKVDVTVLWLALNEECEAMVNPYVQRLYVAYTFLGRNGAELETPVSLPKPMHYVDKCYFNFKKTFELDEADIPKIGHMARCRESFTIANDKNCIIFSVVSEPADDPLGIESCEDIGYAYLYLGDLLAYSAGSPEYTEVMQVRAARRPGAVCGVLAVRLDGLDVVRRCQLLTSADRNRSS